MDIRTVKKKELLYQLQHELEDIRSRRSQRESSSPVPAGNLELANRIERLETLILGLYMLEDYDPTVEVIE